MRTRFITLSLLLALSLATGLALAQGSFKIMSSSFSAGGTSSGGVYSVTTAVGQSHSDVLTGGEYKLRGGYLTAQPGEVRIFLPLVQR